MGTKRPEAKRTWKKMSRCVTDTLKDNVRLSQAMESEIQAKLRKEGRKVAQPCPTLFDPMDCSLPGFSVHGIFQARVLEWVAISFSRGSSRPRDRTRVSHIVGRRVTH